MDDKEDNYTIKQQLVKSNIGLLELLGISFLIFKDHFKTFLIIVLLLGIPLNIVQILYPVSPISLENIEALTIDDMLIPMIHLLINIIFSSLQIAAITFVVKKSILGRYADANFAMKFAFKRLPKVFVTYILLSVSVLIGLVMFILPGIIISILFMLSLYVAADGQRYGISALKYTFNLVKRDTMKVVSTLSFITLFQLSFMIVFGSYVLTSEANSIIYNIIYYLSMYILTGYITTVSATLFFHFKFTSTIRNF